MFSRRSRFSSGRGLPLLVSGVGVLLFVAYFATYFWFNGVAVPSIASIDFVMGLVTMVPFIAGMLYAGHWLERSRLSPGRYPRIGKWFFGGLAGFLLLNAAMIAVWPADSTSNNIAWALFAATAGGAIGLAIGLFEARAIDRAVAAERNRVKHEELKQRNEQLEEFASIVSHDLRNPLNVASIQLELVREEYDDEHVEAVASAHERMETIVDRTLTLARSSQRIGSTRPVDLATVAEDCWGNVATVDRKLKLDGEAVIEADRDRLSHLFENLFRNAVEHAGQDVTVRVGAMRDGFYVEDDGPGIPEDERDDIFEIDYSTSDGGTGFGLSIVERVVEAHDWEIRVTEGSDGGARFEITAVDFAG